MNSKLTLAILTKNRPTELARCLKSVVGQTQRPKIVLIIDNDKKKSGMPVAQKFKTKLPIRYVVETKIGTAHGRNKALELCSTPLLGFTDDDCTLRSRWTEEALLSFAHSKASFVIGRSLCMNQKHPIAAAIYHHHSYWFSRKLHDNNCTPTPFNFDTKNLVLDTKVFRQKKLIFNTEFFVNGVDTSDTDMGFQAKKAGLIGIYSSKMIVSHQEQTYLLHLLRKMYIRGRLAHALVNRWNLTNEFVDPTQQNLFRFLLKSLWHAPIEFRQYLNSYQATLWTKCIAFIVIKLLERTYLLGFYTYEEIAHSGQSHGDA